MSKGRSTWGEGPWQSEPDRKEWRDAETGMPCLAIRHPSLGHWCGYVAVPPSHPAYDKSYDDVDVEVHGGLTYANRCNGHVCHAPEPGEPDDVYWLGFDCAHDGDLLPGLRPGGPDCGYDKYRDLHYVERECARLAQQLTAMRTTRERVSP